MHQTLYYWHFGSQGTIGGLSAHATPTSRRSAVAGLLTLASRSVDSDSGLAVVSTQFRPLGDHVLSERHHTWTADDDLIRHAISDQGSKHRLSRERKLQPDVCWCYRLTERTSQLQGAC